jgi:hypothetical protein
VQETARWEQEEVSPVGLSPGWAGAMNWTFGGAVRRCLIDDDSIMQVELGAFLDSTLSCPGVRWMGKARKIRIPYFLHSAGIFFFFFDVLTAKSIAYRGAIMRLNEWAS